MHSLSPRPIGNARTRQSAGQVEATQCELAYRVKRKEGTRKQLLSVYRIGNDDNDLAKSPPQVLRTSRKQKSYGRKETKRDSTVAIESGFDNVDDEFDFRP